MTRIEAKTLRHNLATCPACRAYLWAEVDVAVEVGEPILSREGKATVYASPRIEAMRVSHDCKKDADE